MPRQLRPLYSGAWYHVTNRGAARQSIFNSELDRQRFLDLLEEATSLHEIEIHAYCLMGNHFHLLVHSPLGNLDKAMHRAMSMYVREFNKRYDRDGPLFKSRYHSTLIADDSYLLAVTRYIHRNPVAFEVSDLAGYRWSSFGQFAGRHRPKRWLSTSFTLRMFGSRRAYVAFVEGPFDGEVDQQLSSDRPPDVLGAAVEQTDSVPGTAA